MKKKRKKLDIIYEDKEILVVNKPAKLLTVATDKEGIRTLYHEVREYLHKKNQKVFVVSFDYFIVDDELHACPSGKFLPTV